MKSTLKLIRRFVFILLLSVVILLVLNFILLFFLTCRHTPNRGGWAIAEEISGALKEERKGGFALSAEGKKILEQQNAWAVLIEDGTGNVIWHSDWLPEEIPLHYSAADISWGTRGYIRDYPTTTASWGEHLVIIGYPKTMYWKLMWNTYDYQMIANVPKILLAFVLANFFFVFAIYMASTSGILRSVRPIVRGIEALPEGEDIYIREKGLLSELAAAINRASEKLRQQERALKKKEMARANWIAGVSHDIRTPLSMVMGYAGQLEEERSLPEQARKKAGIIRIQSVRMKNLVNDLNLSSRLEYNMQPMKQEKMNLVALLRQIVVDFMNLDLEEKYPVSWDTREDLTVCMVNGDRDLLGRAISNVITNAQVHNPDGCRIFASVFADDAKAHIRIEDDGAGVTEEQLLKLQTAPHYMINDGSAAGQRHGLGLLIVRQIAEVHGGSASFSRGEKGGFLVEISVPMPSAAV